MTISPWATGAMKVAVFSAAFAIPGTGIAMAAGPISATSGNGSILGGNQINLPVSAPVDICGNASRDPWPRGRRIGGDDHRVLGGQQQRRPAAHHGC